tara:strand:+ start:710 stop:1003 length:294 start_codon:yes stop_codon:yes gene_type:complete
MKNDELLYEALDNVRNDRSATEDLLSDLISEISASMTTNSQSGVVAAKYVETLQRSNDQLIKIISILKKESKQKEDLTLSNSEKDNIFELIKESAND